jgi:hypothetical protein
MRIAQHGSRDVGFLTSSSRSGLSVTAQCATTLHAAAPSGADADIRDIGGRGIDQLKDNDGVRPVVRLLYHGMRE